MIGYLPSALIGSWMVFFELQGSFDAIIVDSTDMGTTGGRTVLIY